jgi:membrane-associated phospholipid phosphatase
LLSCAGYLGATATAAIRVIKGRHWINDVIGGAIVGIVSARLAYFLVNKFSKRTRIKKINRRVTEAAEEITLSQPPEK